MNERRELGKITRAEFGFGGYQDVQFGISFGLGGKGWGCGDFWGHWGTKRSESCEWSEDDRARGIGQACMRLREVLNAANKRRVSELVGTPIECTFDGNTLKSWRVLTEVV